MSDDSSSRSLLPVVLAVVAFAMAVAGGSLVWVAGVLVERAETAVGSDPRAPAQAAADAEADGWKPWALNDDGRPVRWDPCAPIDLVVNPEGLPRGFTTDLQEAVEEIVRASDLPITVRGEVDEDPSGDRSVHQPERYGERWAPVLVAGAGPDEENLPLRQTDRAIAIPVAVGPAGQRVFVSGQIVLNVERDDLEPGREAHAAPSLGTVLRHELGHLVGLDHVDDPEQLMHAHPGPGEVDLGDGDLRGLEALGAGGCVDAPDPAPVEVDAVRER